MARTSPPARFRELYRENYSFVWHAARRFGVADAQLDDAVQDTFVTAYRRLAALHDDGARPWLYGIARRVASNYRRADHRRRRRHDALADHDGRAASDAPRLEALHALEAFVRSLDHDMREVFVLAELEGMSGSEVAAALAMPVSTTYDRIRATRAKFSAHLQERGALAIARARAERPAASERSWNRLVLCLPAKGLWPAVAGWAGAAKLATATAGGVVAILWVHRAIVDDAAPGASASPPATSSTTADTRIVVPSPAELPAAPASEVIAAAPPAAPTHDARPRVVETSPVSAAPPSETKLLSDAAALLAGGDANGALALTDRHAREFDDSALADVRAALRIESLCKLGKSRQGRAEAKQLLATHPSSPVAMRAQSACDEPAK